MSETNGASDVRNTSSDTSNNSSDSNGSTTAEVDELLDFLASDSDTKGGEVNNKANGVSDTDSGESSNAAGDSHSASTSPPYSSTRDSTPPEVEEGEYSPRERKLLERIEALTQEKLESSKKSTEPTSEDSFSPQEHNFLDGLDIDEVLSSSDNLNKLLLGVYNKALQESSKLSAENIMRSLPSTMSNYVTQHLTMREMVNNFYENNDDLIGAKQTVTDVANKIANENPDLSVEEVFARTAEEARKVLNLKKIEPKSKGNSKPTLHNSRGNGGRARLSVPELDGLAREVNELISD
jgi:hypothetical protein